MSIAPLSIIEEMPPVSDGFILLICSPSKISALSVRLDLFLEHWTSSKSKKPSHAKMLIIALLFTFFH
jgi:hypothetical protein